MHAKENKYVGATRKCTSMTGYLIVFLHYLQIRYELPAILKLEAILGTGNLHHWPKGAKFTSSTKTDWRELLQEFCTYFVAFDYNGVPELHFPTDRAMHKKQFWALVDRWEVPESYRRQHGTALLAARPSGKRKIAARHIKDLCRMLKEAVENSTKYRLYGRPVKPPPPPPPPPYRGPPPHHPDVTAPEFD
ncbi:hypothetical protein M3Y99_01603700 [Aphelenchoides fujianensis]|nr:hypothetical protein M3Y99_01603700 [Aphelenchoides fujianensis]